MNGKKSGSGRKRTKAASLSWRVVGLKESWGIGQYLQLQSENGKMGQISDEEQKG